MTFNSDENPVLPLMDHHDADAGRLLYIHVPFCEKLCPYCSFNRVIFDERLCRRYFAALRKELRLYRDLNYDFKALYAGGGTPTIILEELVDTLALARDLFSIGEISVETNPNHLTPETITLLKQTGVNRLSVGIQSFDDSLLKAMGRHEKYGSGREIMDRLKGASGQFDTLNADMIFNFPGQDEASLRRDIAILLENRLDQVTWYPLMVSDSTRRDVARTLG
ncbi:MAG TPA: radical SAM protein, partial [Synergistetes bacterium]|nr:radical SAM protein [Synergistota bacterium]